MLKDFLKIINLYRGADESQLYHKWLKGGKLHEGIKESFIFQTYVFLKEGVKVAQSQKALSLWVEKMRIG
jgi:hypothetical protein